MGIFLWVLLLNPRAYAATPLDGRRTLGVAPGVYRGQGLLVSGEKRVPNMRFLAERRIREGIIEAKTTVRFVGFDAATVRARLRVISESDGRFTLLDLDQDARVVGGGRCDAEACRFIATVMRGQLTLREKWVPTVRGFAVTEASQDFAGHPGTYGVQFEGVGR